MNIENLSKGQVIRNYKELCLILGEPIKSGKSKNLQLDDWLRYFEYTRQGNKYIIEKIYKEVLPKEDKRENGNNSKYQEDISILLLDLLSQSSDGELFLSAGMLLKKLDMVNGNYSSGRKYIDKLSELIEVPEQNIYDFYNYTQSKLRGNLESALNYLRKKSLIIWSKETTVCVRNIDIEINKLNDIKIKEIKNNKAYFNTTLIHRESTKEEKQLILRCEKEVLDLLGKKDQQEVFLSGQWNYYKANVNKLLLKYGNIEYYYNSYKITYEPSIIIDELDSLIKFTTQKRLNSNIKESITSSAQKRNSKVKNKILNDVCTKYCGENVFEQELSELEKMYLSEKYLFYTDKLIDTTISKDCKNIIRSLQMPVEQDIQRELSEEDATSDLPF